MIVESPGLRLKRHLLAIDVILICVLLLHLNEDICSELGERSTLLCKPAANDLVLPNQLFAQLAM